MVKRKNILVLYGGVNPEHEVAVITAIQVMNALKKVGHEVFPVYITKEGNWIMGDQKFIDPKFYLSLDNPKKYGKKVIFPANRDVSMLRKGIFGFGGIEDKIDLVFPVFHGQNGEDGTVQGLLELSNIPYVGSGVLASSVGMDKYVAKIIASSVGVKVADGFLVTKSTYDKKDVLNNAIKTGFPIYVKPVNLGSSIGISRVDKKQDLENAVQVAFCYDDRVVIEKAVDLEREVNVSIMGNNPYEVSITEQPIASGHTLSFEDKYIANAKSKKEQGMASLKRVIPAPISSAVTKNISESAKKIFGAMNGRGLARIDFMLDKSGQLYFNEINTIPGSLAFYLWEKTNYPFPKLVQKLVELAVESWSQKQEKVTVFESNILAGLGVLGSKGKA